MNCELIQGRYLLDIYFNQSYDSNSSELDRSKGNTTRLQPGRIIERLYQMLNGLDLGEFLLNVIVELNKFFSDLICKYYLQVFLYC